MSQNIRYWVKKVVLKFIQIELFDIFKIIVIKMTLSTSLAHYQNILNMFNNIQIEDFWAFFLLKI